MPSLLFITTDPQPEDRVGEHTPFPLNLPHIDLLTVISDTSIGIDNIREIQHFLQTSPLKSEQKVVYIPKAESLTPEAQNAFLKTLEEPPAYATIILVARSEDQLLSTIISRCRTIIIHHHHTQELDPAVGEWLKKLPSLTLGQKITTLTIYGKTKATALSFLEQLQHHLRESLLKTPNKHTAKNLKLAMETHRHITGNANPALALEDLVLKL